MEVSEGAKEDKEEWGGFLRHLKERGLKGITLVISDACVGLLESVAEIYPKAKWQRCIVRFYRNVFSVAPRGKMREVAVMLQAIHASEDREAAVEKANGVIQKLQERKLCQAAEKIKSSVLETPTYYAFPSAHWRRIRSNNPPERVLRGVRE
jgi:putative transposase